MMSFNDMVKSIKTRGAKRKESISKSSDNQFYDMLLQYYNEGVIDSLTQCIDAITPGKGTKFVEIINQCLSNVYRDEMKNLREMVIQSGWEPPRNLLGMEISEPLSVERRHGSKYEILVFFITHSDDKLYYQTSCSLLFHQNGISYGYSVRICEGGAYGERLVDCNVNAPDEPTIYYDLSEGAIGVFPIVCQALDEITAKFIACAQR